MLRCLLVFFFFVFHLIFPYVASSPQRQPSKDDGATVLRLSFGPIQQLDYVDAIDLLVLRTEVGDISLNFPTNRSRIRLSCSV